MLVSLLYLETSPIVKRRSFNYWGEELDSQQGHSRSEVALKA